jgi:hypothetical protein
MKHPLRFWHNGPSSLVSQTERVLFVRKAAQDDFLIKVSIWFHPIFFVLGLPQGVGQSPHPLLAIHFISDDTVPFSAYRGRGPYN